MHPSDYYVMIIVATFSIINQSLQLMTRYPKKVVNAAKVFDQVTQRIFEKQKRYNKYTNDEPNLDSDSGNGFDEDQFIGDLENELARKETREGKIRAQN